MRRFVSRVTLYLFFICTLAACSSGIGGTGGANNTGNATQTHAPTNTAHATPTVYGDNDACPGRLTRNSTCYTPHALRMAYGLQTLEEQGFTGKGQTVVDIVSFGSPTLQQDMDIFDQQFGLPAIKVQILSPIGTVPFNPKSQDQVGWAGETELDVQIIHAIAPDAGIVVLTSPVSETEGTIGLPEFLKLEQYAVDHHLGQIFSQSYAASEATLADAAGQKLLQTYTNFYKQITTKQGWTVVSGSGDNGATDWADVGMTNYSSTPVVNFPADVPWVTAVGGTSLVSKAAHVTETAWNRSGGGVSKFYAEPDFQRTLPATLQTLLAGKRGLPDIAANANPRTAMVLYIGGGWQQIGGTSASTPLWGAIIAIANQMAGHPLGFINAALYKVAQGSHAQADFRDIVVGNNSVPQPVQVQGYSTEKGWDAVTGWGAPQADHLLPDLIAGLSS